LKYFDRVRPTTVVPAFLGTGSLERRLLALLPGSVGFSCTAQAGDSTTSGDQILFSIPNYVLAFCDVSTNLTGHLAPHFSAYILSNSCSSLRLKGGFPCDQQTAALSNF
jgi:hypothetical protein